MAQVEQYPDWKLKLIFSSIYIMERQKENAQLRDKRSRMISNPETKDAYLAKCAENQRNFRERKKQNPEDFRKWRDGLNESSRRTYSHRRKTDKEFSEYHRKRVRDYFNNTENGKKLRRETMARRRLESPAFRVSGQIRNRIAGAISGRGRFGGSADLIGCTIKDLIKHLEFQFKPGMSWDNYGKGRDKWTMDHIRPIAGFDLSTEEGQRRAFHYTNLQPMWYIENCSKNSIVDGVRLRYSDHKQESHESMV